MAEIRFDFLGNADDLVRETERVEGALGDAEKGSDDFAKAAKIGLGIATAAAVATAAAMVKVGKEVIALSAQANRYAKAAKKIGATATDIQRVEGAFALLTENGVNAGKMIQDLNRGLAEARDGAGPAKDALGKLGLAAADLVGLPVAEQIQIIGTRIHGLGDIANQTQVSMDLFGRSGRELVGAFREGGDAVSTAFEQIEAAGIISNETAAQSEALQDSIELLGRQFGTLKRGALEPLIPIMTAAADGLREFFAAIDTSGGATVIAQFQTAILDLAGPIAGLVKVVGWSVEAFGLQFDALSTLVDQALLAGAVFEALVSGEFSKARDFAGQAGANFEDLGNRILNFGDSSAQAATQVRELLTAIGEAGQGTAGGSFGGGGVGAAAVSAGESAVAPEDDPIQTAIAAEMEKLRELDAQRAEMAEKDRARDEESHRRKLATLDAEVEHALDAAAQRQEAEVATGAAAMSVLGGISSLVKTVGDAQVNSAVRGSEAHKTAMRAAWNAQTAFAVLQAGINIPLSISQASAAGYPQAIGYMVAAGAASGAAFAGVVAKAAAGPPFHRGGVSQVPTAPDEFTANLRQKETVAVFNPGASQSLTERNVHQMNRGDHKRMSSTLILQMNDKTVDVQHTEAIRRPDSPMSVSMRENRPRKVGSARVW
jgi:hypothetical protein